jgi:hypothetical protein
VSKRQRLARFDLHPIRQEDQVIACVGFFGLPRSMVCGDYDWFGFLCNFKIGKRTIASKKKLCLEQMIE